MKNAPGTPTRWVAGLALIAGTLAAAPAAQAMTLPAPPPPVAPQLFVMPPNQPERQLPPAGGCSTHLGQPYCVDPALVPPVPLVLAQPTTVRVRSSLPLAALQVGAALGAQLPGTATVRVTRRDDFLWNVELAGLTGTAPLGFAASPTAAHGGGTWTSVVPVDAEPATVQVVRHAVRGRAVTAVVRSTSPGELRAYATVRGRRRSRVVTATATAGADVTLRIPVAAATLPALGRAGGIAVVLRPSDGRASTRGAVEWRTGKGVSAPAKDR